jgi:hypothetical protein
LFIPSLHVGVGVVHAPLTHNIPAQSLFALQLLPSTHGVQPPPQSRSVSIPLRTLSLQRAAAQVPPLHTLLWQSLPNPQPTPSPQGGQLPPQSTPVSLAFC